MIFESKFNEFNFGILIWKQMTIDLDFHLVTLPLYTENDPNVQLWIRIKKFSISCSIHILITDDEPKYTVHWCSKSVLDFIGYKKEKSYFLTILVTWNEISESDIAVIGPWYWNFCLRHFLWVLRMWNWIFYLSLLFQKVRIMLPNFYQTYLVFPP